MSAFVDLMEPKRPRWASNGGFQPVPFGGGAVKVCRHNAMQFGDGRAYIHTVRANEQRRRADMKPEEPRGALGRLTTPLSINTEPVANSSPAFEAWLRLYRTRLEQLCERPNSHRD